MRVKFPPVRVFTPVNRNVFAEAGRAINRGSLPCHVCFFVCKYLGEREQTSE